MISCHALSRVIFRMLVSVTDSDLLTGIKIVKNGGVFIRYARLQCCPGLRALEYFRWNQFLFCYVLTGTGNLLDLWSFGRRLATAQVSVRIGKGRKILRLYYPYIDVFRVRYNCCFKKGNVQVCRCISMLTSVHRPPKLTLQGKISRVENIRDFV